MKKILLIILTCVMAHTLCFAEIEKIEGQTIDAGSIVLACPAWEPYYFAWDGSGTTQLTACLNSGASEVEGNNTGGVISGSGADTVWSQTVDNVKLEWPVTITDIPYNDAAGITVWIEVQPTTITGTTALFRYYGANSDYYLGRLGGTSIPTGVYLTTAGGSNTLNSGGTISDGVYTTVGFSIQLGSNPDHAATFNKGSSWGEDNDLLVEFDAGATISNIYIGAVLVAWNAVQTDFRRFAVVPGFKTACPW